MAFIIDNIESEGYITGVTVSATTLYGNGVNLIGLPKSTVTGGTYSSGTAVFTNSTGGTFNVTGFSTGGTESPITIVNTSSLFSTGLAGAGSVSTANNSNFFGVNSGSGATNANSSNFFGSGAGFGATNANNSNFFGINTGQNSISANDSNFFGQSAGFNAPSASYSNFIGYNAGYIATSAYFSNFFGYSVGYNATNAFSSNFFGVQVGYGSTNARYSNFFGERAGYIAVNTNNSNFFGFYAGNGATNANNSNFIGSGAGSGATNASYSNLFGYNAGRIFASNNIGSNNIIIGTNISLPSGSTNSINLGGVLFGSGTYSYTGGTPSITGETQGKIGINVVNPTQSFEVSGGTRIYGGLTANTISATTYLNLPSSSFNGGTVTGSTQFTGGLTANTISATTYLNLPAASFSGGTVTGPTQFTNGLTANTISATTYLNLPAASFSGGTVTGPTQFTNGLTANTISATTYLNLPISIVNTNSLISTGLTSGYGTGATFSNFFGQFAGNGATNANNSNFLGQNAGNLATGATYSNFFGTNAGQNATNALQSNFFGNQAGYQATNANNSNFFGQQAGYNAKNASFSNFIGIQAGYQATGATTSNFIGVYAGYGATNASYSNFIGRETGFQATSANNSIFLGYQTGYEALNATNSTFIGNYAGFQASGVTYSTFINGLAGYQAKNAHNSIFIGAQAGFQATNASYSNFIGDNVGYSATNASYSTLIGYNVGNGDLLGSLGSNNIIIGTNISLSAGTTNSINLGGVLFGTGTFSTTGGTSSITPNNGKIGINVVNPVQAFEVSGGTRIYGGLTANTISATTYLNLPSSGGFSWTSQSGLTATGTIQGNSLILNKKVNTINIVASGTGVQLPSATVDDFIMVINHGLNFLKVYPITGETVEGLAVNTPVSLMPGVAYKASVVTAGAWEGIEMVNYDDENNCSIYPINLSAPTTPPADSLRIFNKNIGGRNMLSMVGPSGLDTAIQPNLGRNRAVWWQPLGNATTVPITTGLPAATTLGTATARNVATTNVATRMKRLGYVSSAVAGNFAGPYWPAGAQQYTIGNGSGLGGFHCIWRFVVSDASFVTGTRQFIGWRNIVTAPTNVEPNTLTNSFGIAQLSTDTTQWYIVYGGSAAQTAVALGTSLGAPTGTTTAWDFSMFSPPNSNNVVNYTVTNLGTNVTVSGTLTGVAGTALPLSTALLAPCTWRCNNATASAVGLDICSLYIETDQ
jgi:extradiol dioxygenase family protein